LGGPLRTAFFIQAPSIKSVESLFDTEYTTMGYQWKAIGIPVVEMADTKEFTITLPIEAIEMIEKGLIPFGLYGKKRGTVCAALILDALKRQDVREIIREHMERSSTPPAASSQPT
jgi:hypothetical protein